MVAVNKFLEDTRGKTYSYKFLFNQNYENRDYEIEFDMKNQELFSKDRNTVPL